MESLGLNQGPEDIPDGLVVKNSPCDAGDSGSVPGQGTKIPHAKGQLSPWPQLETSCAGATAAGALQPLRHSQDPTQQNK